MKIRIAKKVQRDFFAYWLSRGSAKPVPMRHRSITLDRAVDRLEKCAAWRADQRAAAAKRNRIALDASSVSA